jgi:hypothetical protein
MMLIDFSRAPTERERKDLRDRLARLETMRTSVTKATDSLAELVTKSSFTEVLVRKDFVYQADAPPGD